MNELCNCEQALMLTETLEKLDGLLVDLRESIHLVDNNACLNLSLDVKEAAIRERDEVMRKLAALLYNVQTYQRSLQALNDAGLL